MGRPEVNKVQPIRARSQVKKEVVAVGADQGMALSWLLEEVEESFVYRRVGWYCFDIIFG